MDLLLAGTMKHTGLILWPQSLRPHLWTTVVRLCAGFLYLSRAGSEEFVVSKSEKKPSGGHLIFTEALCSFMVMTLGSMYIPESYMEPLGFGV